MISHDKLLKLLHYDPETGVFTRLDNTCQLAFRGRQSKGSVTSHGYLKVSAGGRQYYAHRLAWFYMTGSWPEYQIDHKNGKRSDNRWENLREATQQNNSANMCRRLRNKTGFKGVVRRGSRFLAYIHARGIKTRYLGSYSTPEEANAAYLEAAKKFFGPFARAA